MYRKIMVVILFSVLFSGVIYSSDESGCIQCHGDEDLTTERNGREVSLYVNDVKYLKSAHQFLSCEDCHEDFDQEEIPHKEGKNIAKVDCGNCHEEHVLQSKFDIHYRLRAIVKRNGPNCISCHGYHYVKNPSSVRNKNKEYCSGCHNNLDFSAKYHSFNGVKDSVCAECHDADETREKLEISIHKDLSCTDCHRYTANNFKDHQEGVPYLEVAKCSTCHKDEYEEHRESIHGISLSEGIDEAANCWDCHGSHTVKNAKNPDSQVSFKNLSGTCAKCHNQPQFIEKFGLSSKQIVTTYLKSIHGAKLEGGNLNVASCTRCHGVHNIKNRVQQNSTISTFNIPKTCGVCHEKAKIEYEESIHWMAAKRGAKFAPVCNDCHQEHSIHEISGKDRREYAKIVQEKTCMSCHQSEMIGDRFGLQVDEAVTYQDSYHGLAVLRGDEAAAMCIDCHGVHKILPKKNPGSAINVANIQGTCSKCHANASLTFSKSYSHHAFSKESKQISSIVEYIYFWLIVVVIGGMVFHNLLIFIHELRKKKKSRNGLPAIQRFTISEVIQHILLLVSFITLAVTGFALKFGTSWWAAGWASIGMTEDVRQIIHRVAAVVMVIASLYHVYYLIFTKRGRILISALLPKFKDVTDVVKNISYYLGISKNPPEFDRYDYTEKAEYWALIWGTIVMGITGLILWFPTIVGNNAPDWLIKVSEIIHFYEAILATLAIIVWHWFFVILHPKEYPMNFTWTDGQMTLNHYKHHHRNHFKFILLDWMKYKTGDIDYEELNLETKMLIENIRKEGHDEDIVFKSQLENDLDVKNWIESRMGENTL